MTLTSEPGTFEDMLRVAAELDTPDGYKAELFRGKIIVSPWPRARELLSMRSLRRLLEPHTPEGYATETAPFLFRLTASERAFGPELFVAEETAFAGPGRHVDGEALALVAEPATASERDVDWQDKLAAYGRQVPVYLVLDMRDEEITAFWDPSPRGYRSRTTVPFGHTLHVPAPFDFDLDTSGFRVPSGM
ncbi:hypothetical protein AMK26_02645 [Streptomyces sp. CB03234]|uniref:Uma2 family endonuclease n=1 Tax=Streptomyces sp. (strain CB03234) TaxID=1703937 RepID=UPI000939757D|nr:Uma2 family endonuclease [Streptomyces sp. CB03234]OKK07970.1 hypothetical protein AMK26_02645 [Streptomyces sp. CB03234]